MISLGCTARRTLGILAIAAMIPAAGFAFGGPRDGGTAMDPPQEAIDGGHGGMGPGRHFARMAKELNLTEDQKTQIKTILESERQNAAPLRKQLAENREEMRKAIESQPFDESAVRALATRQNAARVELIVSRARVKSQIHALLTPEQRDMAKKLRAEGKGRHGHPHGM